MKQGLLHIRVEITLGKYQEQLLNLERKLESGLYCELTDKELKDSYVEYTLLYDTIANRISIEDVQAKDGRLRLMENVWWEYDKLPHMLIAGGTGGGGVHVQRGRAHECGTAGSLVGRLPRTQGRVRAGPGPH